MTCNDDRKSSEFKSTESFEFKRKNVFSSIYPSDPVTIFSPVTLVATLLHLHFLSLFLQVYENPVELILINFV